MKHSIHSSDGFKILSHQITINTSHLKNVNKRGWKRRLWVNKRNETTLTRDKNKTPLCTDLPSWAETTNRQPEWVAGVCSIFHTCFQLDSKIDSRSIHIVTRSRTFAPTVVSVVACQLNLNLSLVIRYPCVIVPGSAVNLD